MWRAMDVNAIHNYYLPFLRHSWHPLFTIISHSPDTPSVPDSQLSLIYQTHLAYPIHIYLSSFLTPILYHSSHLSFLIPHTYILSFLTPIFSHSSHLSCIHSLIHNSHQSLPIRSLYYFLTHILPQSHISPLIHTHPAEGSPHYYPQLFVGSFISPLVTSYGGNIFFITPILYYNVQATKFTSVTPNS